MPNGEITPTVITDRPGESEGRLTPVLMTPLAIVAVRVARTWLQSVLGLIPVALMTSTSDPTPADLFLRALLTAASWAVGPAVICLLQNSVELLAAIDVKTPWMRA